MIEIINISKKFENKLVIHNLNAKLEFGINCIMEPSGSGKTTLANIIAGILKPDSGEIKGTGDVSMVFQEDRLLENETALTNVLFVNSEKYRLYAKIKAKALLEKLSLENELNTKVKNLSGGMKRRVAICRALLANYDTLILDEPFKGLDEKIKKNTMDIVKEYSKDKIVILITHNVNEANYLNARILDNIFQNCTLTRCMS